MREAAALLNHGPKILCDFRSIRSRCGLPPADTPTPHRGEPPRSNKFAVEGRIGRKPRQMYTSAEVGEGDSWPALRVRTREGNGSREFTILDLRIAGVGWLMEISSMA